MKLYKKIFIAVFASLSLISCSDSDLDVVSTKQKPVDQIKTLGDIKSLVNGALNILTASEYYGRDYIVYGETYADNAYANGNTGRFTNLYYPGLRTGDAQIRDTWEVIYQLISTANLVISKSITVSPQEQEAYDHLVGEAYFFRALAHFDLLRFYGQQNVDINNPNALGIPYETVFHPEGDDILIPRNTVQEVYTQLYKDLDMAIEKMKESSDYQSIAYVNSWAAKALKARIALYKKDYPTVISYTDEIINSGRFKVPEAEDFVKGWSRTSNSNWIFALANTATDNRGNNGLSYIYQNTGYGDVLIKEDLVKSVFSETDVRGLPPMIKEENGFRNYGKYPQKDPADYYVPIFRYEEVLMSNAEAKFYQNNNKAEALNIFNQINRARNAEEIADLNKDIIINEWRKEFYFEGFRFHTLARNGKRIEVPVVEKDIEYGNFQYAFPIPKTQITRNKNIVQNKGY